MYFLIAGVALGLVSIVYLNKTHEELSDEERKKKNDDCIIERKKERLNSR